MPSDPRLCSEDRLDEIRAWLSTGENADPSCAGCHEHLLLGHIDAQSEALRTLTDERREIDARTALAEQALLRMREERVRWHEILEVAEELADAVSAAHLSIPDGDFTRIMRALGRWRALGRGVRGETGE